MIDRLNSRTRPFSHILLILTGALVLVLLVGFGQKVREGQQRRVDLQLVMARLAAATEKKAGLQERYEYLQTPAAAEEWARSNGQAMENEVPVVILAPSGETASLGNKDPGAGGTPGSPSEAWWDLFFGNR